MADQQELFNTLADASGDGAAPLASSAGDAGGAQGSQAYAYRDSSGNVIQPQLDAMGKIPVTLGSAGAKISGHATVTPADSNDTDVVTLTLAASTTYVISMASGSSTKSVLWKIEQTDDAATSDAHKFITGPGAFTQTDCCECIEITTGATGTQELKLIGNQIQGGSLSDMHGSLCVQATA